MLWKQNLSKLTWEKSQVLHLVFEQHKDSIINKKSSSVCRVHCMFPEFVFSQNLAFNLYDITLTKPTKDVIFHPLVIQFPN